jgi:hypothetical protein
MNGKNLFRKELFVFILLLGFLLIGYVGCGAAGWNQANRDKIVTGCVDKAKAGAPNLDETKLKSYCSCYQQELEKKYPSVASMATAKTDDLTKTAEGCLKFMF